MTIWLLVQPGDYTRAGVEAFRTKEEAEAARDSAKSDGEETHYWTIEQQDV